MTILAILGQRGQPNKTNLNSNTTPNMSVFLQMGVVDYLSGIIRFSWRYLLADMTGPDMGLVTKTKQNEYVRDHSKRGMRK